MRGHIKVYRFTVEDRMWFNPLTADREDPDYFYDGFGWGFYEPSWWLRLWRWLRG